MSNITVTHVGVRSIGKLIGTVNLIIGLFVGIVAAVGVTISYFASESPKFFEGLLGSLAIFSAGVILYPLVMFLVGWIYGVLVAFIFNAVIGVSGGIELTTEQTVAKK